MNNEQNHQKQSTQTVLKLTKTDRQTEGKCWQLR